LIVRQAEPGEYPIWARLLAKLHPDQSAEDFERELAAFASLPEPYVCFLAFEDGGESIGMVDARVRNYAEGAPDLRAGYVEDIWVEPEHRRLGVGQALVAAVEQWARDQGLNWLGSDTELDNVLSQEWHQAIGFHIEEKLVVFGKRLG
jgi:aminoglycoside 6'-N-acetyltransferase I